MSWAICRCPLRQPRRCFRLSQRYLKTSIVITTNRGVGAWGDIFADTTIAAAMLDRLLHRSIVINISGDSYRMRTHRARNRKLTEGDTT